MRFRSPERRRQARQKTADRAAAKLINSFMIDSNNRYLTYHLSFLQRCHFTPLGGDGTGATAINRRARHFEEAVVSRLAAEGIRVESDLELILRSKLFDPAKKRLHACTLTVQRA